MGSRPVVLLDVDGVLNPLERAHSGYRRFKARPSGVRLKLWLNAAHGPMLLDMVEATGAELVWATYWRDEANEWVGHRIGLPDLPFVPIPRYPGAPDGVSLGAWKARHVATWVEDRPFVWFEDEPDVAERLLDHFAEGSHLLVRVNPLQGLLEGHIDRARAWLSMR